MRVMHFLVFLATGAFTAVHAQDAARPPTTTDGATTKQENLRPGAPRRAEKAAAAERPECTISVTPHVVPEPGRQVRVTWTTKNATSASIEGIGKVSPAPQQKVTDNPDRTKIYEMAVSGPKGTGTCRVAVAVPRRAASLQWPPSVMANMPADYLERARASLEQRIAITKLTEDHQWVGYAIASLLLEQDVDIINEFFANRWKISVHADRGFALFSMDAIRLYGLYNAKSKSFPGRLTAAAQRHMEEEFYKVASQTRYNDYRRSSDLSTVWTLESSDNHTFAAKSSFLLASQFLKNSAALADRTFEDGRKPAEHYEAWRKHWSTLLDERARRGIYVEIASPHYEDETRQAIQNIRDFAEDPILRQKAEMLLDITYALIAQDILQSGARGGAKSRVYTFSRQFFNGGDDRSYNLIFGLPGPVMSATVQASSTYFPPPLVLKLGQDIAARGRYENVQRVPGVGERMKKTTTLDPEKSVVRYGFVTPSYVIGSFSLDPKTTYAPMSAQNRWQGVVFEGDRSSRIAPHIARTDRNGELIREQRVMDGFVSLQDRNILITQRAEGKGGADVRVGFYVSNAFDRVEEEDGWIFLRERESFGALRVVALGPNAYRWMPTAERNKNADDAKNAVILRDPNSPIIIVASEAGDYGNDFAKFKAALKKQKIEYDRRVLRFADLAFYGSEKIGTRSGVAVDLSPPRLYDSPFIRSEWLSGKIFMKFGNEGASFNFSDTSKPQKKTSDANGIEFPPGVGRAKAIVFAP
jgi:hypothetical protein